MKQDELKAKVKNRLKLYNEQLESTVISLKTEIEVHSKSFRTKEEVENIIRKIDNQCNPIIYKILISSKEERERLISCYKEFYKTNKTQKRGIGRLNVSRFNDTDSEIIYIGSKMKKPRSRFKQHLGEGHFATYSLHLNKWAAMVDYNLKIEIYDIKSDIEDRYKRNFIELIEQELWEEALPIFGKKSGL